MNRISITYEKNAVWITLKHPPVNVIDIAMMEELSAAIAGVEARADVPVMVFRGEGDNFSAGVDIAAHTPEKIEEMLRKFHAVILAVARSPKVSIAAVHGNCLGGGAELAMVCDMVYTTADAKWGFPEIKLACYPPVACVALASLVGQKCAAELILTGRTFDGAYAEHIGLANSMAASRVQLQQMVETSLGALGQMSAAALSVTKKAIYTWDGLHLDKGIARAEKIYLEELMKTEDVKEGVQAWMEKRASKWKHR
ncbi:MAG TPA: enoyl-CoA hydratase/isomerase family protein [Terriglobales bacterium]|nr:enoyl-CoA hydratase/isomerase family protein [Terriglobales bacterium]